MLPRTLLVSALLTFALACASAPGLATVAPHAVPAGALTAAQRPVQDVVTTSSFPLQAPAWPDTTPSVVGSYVAMVLNISGTPCFDCVNSKTKGTFGSATRSAT